jgi:alpha-D-xyloside xylohydrolase
LVAPIFNEIGKASYYLPNGTWVSLLTDEVREGGKWYTDTYDYFTLPLYVRENTLLARGFESELPDYDYADRITFHLYQLKDGGKAKSQVPDIAGNIVLVAEAQRDQDTITFSVSDLEKKPCFILHHIEHVSEIIGGEAKLCEEEICLIPNKEKVQIIL